jgi:uncharacterized protein
MPAAAQVSPGETVLERLDRYLRSQDTPPACMQISELDGFLTGIIVGPQPISRSEWLPVVWGRDGLAHASHGTAQAIVDAVTERFAEIAAEIREVMVGPVFLSDRNGDLITSDWAEGFAQAMMLRSRQWEELAKSPVGVDLLLPILLLRGDEDLMQDIPTADRIEAVRKAAEQLPVTLLTLKAFCRCTLTSEASN